jgi:hypothetical protein
MAPQENVPDEGDGSPPGAVPDQDTAVRQLPPMSPGEIREENRPETPPAREAGGDKTASGNGSGADMKQSFFSVFVAAIVSAIRNLFGKPAG